MSHQLAQCGVGTRIVRDTMASSVRCGFGNGADGGFDLGGTPTDCPEVRDAIFRLAEAIGPELRDAIFRLAEAIGPELRVYRFVEDE